MTFTKKESLKARRVLKLLLKDLDTKTVYVVQRHVSRSGKQRKLDLYLIPNLKSFRNTNLPDYQIEPYRITYSVAQAIQWPYDEKWGSLTVNGCGMDMHFHTVYTLSQVLYSGEKLPKHDQGYYLVHKTI